MGNGSENITSMALLPENVFDALQKGSVETLLTYAAVGDRVSVAINDPQHSLSSDEAWVLFNNPKHVAIVQSVRMLDSQSADDVDAFAKHTKLPNNDAKTQMIVHEELVGPHCLVTLVPELKRPSPQPASARNSQPQQ